MVKCIHGAGVDEICCKFCIMDEEDYSEIQKEWEEDDGKH